MPGKAALSAHQVSGKYLQESLNLRGSGHLCSRVFLLFLFYPCRRGELAAAHGGAEFWVHTSLRGGVADAFSGEVPLEVKALGPYDAEEAWQYPAHTHARSLTAFGVGHAPVG